MQTDGVARREVRHRLVQAKRLLDETLSQAFSVADRQNICWIEGQPESIGHITAFNTKLSDICDQVYSKSLILWNELINRRELTSQGAKARRLLIEAMLACSDQERLGLQGYGPEVSMYFSMLGETKIHRQEEGNWGFYPPLLEGMLSVWQATEGFCLQAKEKPQTLDKLYQYLEAPPFGVKIGTIPVLLAAVLLCHVDDVSIYRDGAFIPVLGTEHFELLVTRPDGQEFHQTVWFDRERQDQIEYLFNETLGILNQYDNTQLQKAVVAKLAERVLSSQDNVTPL